MFFLKNFSNEKMNATRKAMAKFIRTPKAILMAKNIAMKNQIFQTSILFQYIISNKSAVPTMIATTKYKNDPKPVVSGLSPRDVSP